MSKDKKTLQPLTLKEWREDTGHTQTALAKKLNLLAPYISNYENEKQKPAQEVKDKFRKLFPGYDVIEMRDSFEPPDGAIEHASTTEQPEALQTAEPIEQIDVVLRGSKLYVLQNASSTAVFLTKSSAMEELTKIILEDPEAYGWRIVEAEMK